MFVVEKSKAIQTLHCAICIFVAIIFASKLFPCMYHEPNMFNKWHV